MVKWWVPYPSETSVSFGEKEAEKIMERWRRASPFVTWPLDVSELGRRTSPLMTWPLDYEDGRLHAIGPLDGRLSIFIVGASAPSWAGLPNLVHPICTALLLQHPFFLF